MTQKFRTYYIKEKRYLLKEDIAIDGIGHIMRWSDQLMKWIDLSEEEKKDYIVEFAIGLKDSGKKDIYKGDIIKHALYNYPFVVDFEAGAYIITAGACCKYAVDIHDFEKNTTIIGNIHEHAHFLEDKKDGKES